MSTRKSPENLAEALKLEPQQMAALIALGHQFYENGKYKTAKDIFQGIQVLDAKNPYAPAILGSIAQREKKYANAISQYSLAIALHPKGISLLVNRGECYLAEGKLAEAGADFRDAIQLDPKQTDPAANRARFLGALTLEGLELAEKKGIKAVMEAKRRIDEQLAL